MDERRVREAIETMSWDMTIGSGNTEVKPEELIQRIEAIAGRKLSTQEEKACRAALQQRDMEMAFP